MGMGEKWRIFVKLMKAVWEQGSVPEQMKWEIIALLPQGGGDYCGVGLLEPFLEGHQENYGCSAFVGQVP